VLFCLWPGRIGLSWLWNFLADEGALPEKDPWPVEKGYRGLGFFWQLREHIEKAIFLWREICR
jgi:hypothetical protein